MRIERSADAMPPSPAELAAHALRVKSNAVAGAAVASLYRLRPDLEQRYGEAGRRHCAKDLAHHLRFLAAAVELEDAKVFVDYAAWAARVMVRHGVAADDALASFRCLLDAAPAVVPAGSGAFVRDVTAAALAGLEGQSARWGSPRRRASPRGTYVRTP